VEEEGLSGIWRGGCGREVVEVDKIGKRRGMRWRIGGKGAGGRREGLGGGSRGGEEGGSG
jgi:hypothetical protein